jgi:uncharacterized protein (DUF433 family)
MFTREELKDRMKERESPDDILDILEPTTEDLVEALDYYLEDEALFTLLCERYED